jgi:hypothetical protein
VLSKRDRSDCSATAAEVPARHVESPNYGLAMQEGLRVVFERRLRPLRIGYRVDPLAARDLGRAIETAAAQWGGLYHPLIPVMERRPAWWRDLLDPQPDTMEDGEGPTLSESEVEQAFKLGTAWRSARRRSRRYRLSPALGSCGAGSRSSAVDPVLPSDPVAQQTGIPLQPLGRLVRAGAGSTAVARSETG